MADDFWGWIGGQIGVLIYEWITGDDHPQHQTNQLENQVIEEQTELIVGGVNAVWDGMLRCFDEYGEMRHQLAGATYNFVEDRFSTPLKAANTFGALAFASEGMAMATKAHPVATLVFETARWIFTGLAVALAIAGEE